MVWRRLFHRENEPEHHSDKEPAADEEARSHSASPATNPVTDQKAGTANRIPLHLQQSFASRRRTATDDPSVRLATLQRRRTAALFDLEQGELALQDDNPWKQRASLLTEALETVQHDRDSATSITPGPFHQLPDTPILHQDVSFDNDAATVRFDIGKDAFRYEEPLDWAERGHQVIRGELARTAGSSDALVPADTPEDLRAPLRAHLDLSLFVFASELRARALDAEPLPDNATLADLARPCPVCGGWSDFLGRCQACARRNASIQRLDQERNRLLNDRAAEFEEERRMAERVPVARRRLADIDTEIEAIERAMNNKR